MIKLDFLGKRFKSNLFVTYFILFASIILAVLAILGVSLILLVNMYSLDEKTKLLSENTQAISSSISSTLGEKEINDTYSDSKNLICISLGVVSRAIDADIFVCDASGDIVLCKEKSNLVDENGSFGVCVKHGNIKIDDSFLQQVYEGGAVSRGMVGETECYIVGTAIEKDKEIVGSVFAVTPVGTSELVAMVIRIFFASAVFSLFLASAFIWILTKKLITPLQDMSTAAKQFAVGDFSYRLNVDGDDELSELGRAFNDMADALDKLESSRRSFVANVSHELKTPMTSIAGFIDGILDGTIPPEREKHYLKIVSDEVRRLSRLVVAMLNMSKIESGDFEMKPKDYDIGKQMFNVLLNFEQKIDKKSIEIKGFEDIQAVKVHADPDMIYQVIYNLFDNAVKFTNDSGYIQVGVEDLPNCVEVHIKNSCNEIDSKEMSKIFERFYKIDKSRSLDSNGAGLGLYIAKMMVEMHNGRIFAKTNNGNEAEFVFTLPKA